MNLKHILVLSTVLLAFPTFASQAPEYDIPTPASHAADEVTLPEIVPVPTERPTQVNVTPETDATKVPVPTVRPAFKAKKQSNLAPASQPKQQAEAIPPLPKGKWMLVCEDHIGRSVNLTRILDICPSRSYVEEYVLDRPRR